MRRAPILLLEGIMVLALALSARAQAQAPDDVPGEPVGSMSELMAKIILPTSDAILYIASRTPENDAQWAELQAQALMLAESANLLMMPSRALDQDLWLEDSQLLLDAGRAAFEGAMKRDVEALSALNDPLYSSCIKCHEDYEVAY